MSIPQFRCLNKANPTSLPNKFDLTGKFDFELHVADLGDELDAVHFQVFVTHLNSV